MPPENEEWTTIVRGPRQRKDANPDIHENEIIYEFRERVTTRRRIVAGPLPFNSRQEIENLKEKLLHTKWWAKTRELLLEAADGNTMSFVQCLGLGRICTPGYGCHQFACALLMRDLFDCARCTVCDPVMEDEDRKVASSFNVHVVEPVKFKNVAIQKGCGVLYMPHCDSEFYEAVLERWVERLEEQPDSHLVLLGNDLSGYVTATTKFDSNCTAITAITSWHATFKTPVMVKLFEEDRVIERICAAPKLATVENAFNNMKVTTIKKKR